MRLKDVIHETGVLLEGDEMTGRQAAYVIGFWMLATALFGLISYIVVFVIIGF